MYPIVAFNYFLSIMSLGLPTVLYFKTNHVWSMTTENNSFLSCTMATFADNFLFLRKNCLMLSVNI